MRKRMTRREREVTDKNEIIDILDKCKILHLGLADGDEPYVVPMNYGYVMDAGKLTLYLHGAAAGYKTDVMKKNPKVFFEMECDVHPFEGRMPCQYGTEYQSIMGSGTAEILENIEEKKEAMTLFMKSQTGKDFQFEDRLVSIVSLIRITVSWYTAKRRINPAALGDAE
ncbi:MAG: pyridoxamine 5'-phosphate oxidase family protein [Schaedlerella sp.]|nr:pyridoxamine 5'-phosphate oxidase family protein [Lachnospiraceae bacterium]MDY4201727.1 pyridoxamine 5'-phosphate oxidase family protein [Schaedlerella sp.]